jgi:hypothetical protein
VLTTQTHEKSGLLLGVKGLNVSHRKSKVSTANAYGWDDGDWDDAGWDADGWDGDGWDGWDGDL